MDREGINSDYFNMLTSTSIFPRLGAKGLVKCKANLNYPTIQNQTGVFHTDFNDTQNKDITTSILYINTNDGGTKFEDDTKVESVANRMVTFDCSTKHAPVSCTDKKRRLVVNFNYYKSKEIMEKNYIGKK